LGKLSSSGDKDLRQSAAAGQKQLMEAVNKTKQAKVQTAYVRTESDKIIQASVKQLLAKGGKAAAEDITKYGQRLRSSLSKVESILDQSLKSKNLGGQSLSGLGQALSLTPKTALAAAGPKIPVTVTDEAILKAILAGKPADLTGVTSDRCAKIQSLVGPEAAKAKKERDKQQTALSAIFQKYGAKNLDEGLARWKKGCETSPSDPEDRAACEKALADKDQAVALDKGIKGLKSRLEHLDRETGKLATCAGQKPLSAETKKSILDFVSRMEGGQLLTAKVPQTKNDKSGVTVATGVDLYQKRLELGALSPELKKKLQPYLKLQGQAARDFITKKKPLVLTKAEADELDRAVREPMLTKVVSDYNKASKGKKFEELPIEAQSVIDSVKYQYPNGAPTFWKAVTEQRWKDAVKELRNFKDEHKTRRKAEADYLEQAIKRGALK
jgi:hypothetical protein